MAQGSQTFALVGYSDVLERRPLRFVDPIPASRICSACGNIPRRTYTFVCGHSFCQPCYESCSTTSDCTCPLDEDVCGRDDVTTKEYPADQLLRRKVHCWNENNGCRAVLPAAQVADHVRQDCQHHVSRCPACSAAVLSRDVCAHLKSRCTASVLNVAPEPQQGREQHSITELTAFERAVEQRVGELDAKLAQLSLENASQTDKLLELCHSGNGLKEALTQQFETSSVRTLDCFNKGVAEMKACYSEQCESLIAAVNSALTSVPSYATTHQQVIAGYAALKEKALKDGWCSRMSEKVYLRRYLLSWGIYFKKEGDSVDLFLRFQLHEGKEDGFLDWPFKQELRLSIIHPQTREERVLVTKSDLSEEYRKFYCRPIGTSNRALCFSDTRVDSSNIAGDGYIESDQLLVRLEVAL